ncbi:MAG: tRNA (cytidine(34)-2'-O)-methyltransferase [Pseudomonadota bacterium]
MRLVLYEPENPRNAGALIRLCACLGTPLDIIEPCGFVFSARDIKKSALDYGALAAVETHSSWAAFAKSTLRKSGRLILLTTKADGPYYDFEFRSGDLLLLGQESAGVPDVVHNAADARVTIPMADGARSLNVAMAGGIVLSEALRQMRQT